MRSTLLDEIRLNNIIGIKKGNLIGTPNMPLMVLFFIIYDFQYLYFLDFKYPGLLKDFPLETFNMFMGRSLSLKGLEKLSLAWEATFFDKPSDGIGSLLQHFLPYLIKISNGTCKLIPF